MQTGYPCPPGETEVLGLRCPLSLYTTIVNNGTLKAENKRTGNT